MLRKIILLVALVALGASLVGCKTVQGIGEDIQTVGEAGEKAVD